MSPVPKVGSFGFFFKCMNAAGKGHWWK
jgi:hypothetical protein